MMKYFLLQLKRVSKLLPYIFAAMAALFACLLLAFHYVDESSSQESSVRFKLGIVGNTDDSYLMAGLEIVQSYDSARFAVDTVQMEENEALRALENGEIGAYVVIPEDYIRNAMGGKLGSLKYVSTTGAADLTTLFKSEITAVVSDIIIACEQAMYGVEDTLALKELDDRAGAYIYDISMTYVDYILEREDMYFVETLGLHDALGMDGYLFSGICVLILTLLLIPVCAVAIKSEFAFERLVKSKRIGALGQVAGEYDAIFVIYALLFLALSLIVSVYSSQLSPALSRLCSVFSIERIYVVFAVLFTLSALSYLLLQLVKNMVSGVLLHFVVGLVLCFVSGCLYPLSFFPDSMQSVAKLLPHYYCRSVFAAVITQDPVGSQILSLIFYGAVLLVISVFVRQLRLRKGHG